MFRWHCWTRRASMTRSTTISRFTSLAARTARRPSSDFAAWHRLGRVTRRPHRRPSLGVPRVEGPRGVTPLADGLRIELKAGEAARVALANGQSSELRGPCAVEFWSSSTEVGGWRLAPVKIETADTVLPEPEVAARAALTRTQ